MNSINFTSDHANSSESGKVSAATKVEVDAERAPPYLAQRSGSNQVFIATQSAHPNKIASLDSRQALTQQLPERMMPTAFVRLQNFPLALNSKVDRRALPQPESNAVAQSDYAAPLTDMEICLASIWSKLLKRQCISKLDNFFALGGHSLLVTRVISRLSKLLNMSVPLPFIFDALTLKQLAARLDILKHKQDGPLESLKGPDRDQHNLAIHLLQTPPLTLLILQKI